MPRINLLPWRDEQRAQRRSQFFAALGLALAGAAAITLLGITLMDGIINHQRDRNARLEAEIAELDKRIAEILELEQEKERLLARMRVIEQLQSSRPEIVHAFDELVRALPDGVYLTSVKQKGSKITINGVAESNTRVSAFMRNIDKSDWLTKPDLEIVEVTNDRRGGTRQSQFTVYATQTAPRRSGDEDLEGEDS